MPRPHPPSPGPSLHLSPAQTLSGPRSSSPAAWSTAAARPSSSISCPQSALSVSASAPFGSRWRLPPPATSASASWPPPSACAQNSRYVASSAVTGSSFRPASPTGNAGPCPPSSAVVSASGKPCLLWLCLPCTAASSLDSVPKVSSALHRSAPAGAPERSRDRSPAPAAQVPAVDGLSVGWLSMVCRSQFRAPWLKSSFPPFYRTLNTVQNLNWAKLIEFSKHLLHESIAK